MNPNYLSDKDKAYIMAFTKNQGMMDAVQKVLLATVYHQGVAVADDNPTQYNFAFNIVQGVKSNEQLGEELRASVTALNYIRAGFERLSEVQDDAPKKKKENPAL